MKTRITLAMIVAGAMMFSDCGKEEYIIATSDDVLMGVYFEENGIAFSKFHRILELSGTLSFLNAYGTYTCFAPTNEAIDAYVAAKGKSSIEDFSPEELKEMVRFHVIIDTINSTGFTDGKLATPTMFGQYLTAVTYFEEGESKIKINKYAEIETKDIRVANGIIHSLKSVLEPVVISVAEVIEQNPDFSIFTEALKETGLYDTLKLMPSELDEEKRWFTVLVHTDEVFNMMGINSFEDLKAKYSNTGNPKDKNDSLYLYMAYHILDYSLKYVADLVTASAHLTFAPLEVITIRLKSDSVLVNEDIFYGKLEKGSLIDRINSDNTTGNGVYHVVENNIYIKVRFPIPVYWDVCDQPEIRKLAGVFRKPGMDAFLSAGQLANVTWSNESNIQYWCAASGKQALLIYSDYLEINLRTADINWIEFTTPLIVKGKYKLWICCRNVNDPNRRPKFMVYFNDEALPNIVATDFTMSRVSDEELELQGLKRYNYDPEDSTFLTNHFDSGQYFTGRLAGTVDVPTTGNHKIKFTVINNGDKYLWLDMIQFIPSDLNQIWPRVDNKGILVDKPDWYPLPQ
jgi:uncharacterized surface protein with fasciclin (FAS1) repeats